MRYVIEQPQQPAIPVAGEDAAFPVRRDLVRWPQLC